MRKLLRGILSDPRLIRALSLREPIVDVGNGKGHNEHDRPQQELVQPPRQDRQDRKQGDDEGLVSTWDW